MEADMSTRATAEGVSISWDGRMAVSFRAGVEGLGDQGAYLIIAISAAKEVPARTIGIGSKPETKPATIATEKKQEKRMKVKVYAANHITLS